MSEIRKEQKPGLFVPIIDRTKCEGGYHHAFMRAECTTKHPDLRERMARLWSKLYGESMPEISHTDGDS